MPHDQSQKQADPNAAGSLFWGSLGQACKADNPGVSSGAGSTRGQSSSYDTRK